MKAPLFIAIFTALTASIDAYPTKPIPVVKPAGSACVRPENLRPSTYRAPEHKMVISHYNIPHGPVEKQERTPKASKRKPRQT